MRPARHHPERTALLLKRKPLRPGKQSLLRPQRIMHIGHKPRPVELTAHIHFTQCWRINHTQLRRIVIEQRNIHRKLIIPLQKLPRAIQRINNPQRPPFLPILVRQHLSLLTDHKRPRQTKNLTNHPVRLPVRLGHRRIISLHLNIYTLTLIYIENHLTRLQRSLYSKHQLRTRLHNNRYYYINRTKTKLRTQDNTF